MALEVPFPTLSSHCPPLMVTTVTTPAHTSCTRRLVAQPLYQQYDATRPWLWTVKHNGRGIYKILAKLMQ